MDIQNVLLKHKQNVPEMHIQILKRALNAQPKRTLDAHPKTCSRRTSTMWNVLHTHIQRVLWTHIENVERDLVAYPIRALDTQAERA